MEQIETKRNQMIIKLISITRSNITKTMNIYPKNKYKIGEKPSNSKIIKNRTKNRNLLTVKIYPLRRKIHLNQHIIKNYLQNSNRIKMHIMILINKTHSNRIPIKNRKFGGEGFRNRGIEDWNRMMCQSILSLVLVKKVRINRIVLLHFMLHITRINSKR